MRIIYECETCEEQYDSEDEILKCSECSKEICSYCSTYDGMYYLCEKCVSRQEEYECCECGAAHGEEYNLKECGECGIDICIDCMLIKGSRNVCEECYNEE